MDNTNNNYLTNFLETANNQHLQQFFITRGVPRSGKTYWAEELVRSSGRGGVEGSTFDWVHISCRDDLRQKLFGKYVCSKAQEKEVTRVQEREIVEALEQGRSVVVGDTNLNPSTFNRLCILLQTYNSSRSSSLPVELVIKDFTDVDLDVCIKRDLQCERSVGRDVILDFHHRYIRPTLYKHNSYKEGKPKAIIVDIDGTVAEKSPQRGYYSWDKVGLDLPRTSVIEVVEMYAKEGYCVLFCSGRMDSCRQETLGWLQEHLPFCCNQFSGFQINLFMRETGDMRKDTLVKREIFMKHIDQAYNIKVAIDDRASVCRLWKDLGLTVLNVSDRDSDF